MCIAIKKENIHRIRKYVQTERNQRDGFHIQRNGLLIYLFGPQTNKDVVIGREEAAPATALAVPVRRTGEYFYCQQN